MKIAIDIDEKKIVDILPDNATENHQFLILNDYRLLEIEEPYNEDGSFIELTTQMLKPFLLESINKEFDDAVNELTADVPEKEQMTWTKQEEEAKAYLENPLATTTVLDGILAERPKFTTKTELANRVLYKADLYAQAVSKLVGIRQRKEDDILDAA